jgi:hypothetical protein
VLSSSWVEDGTNVLSQNVLNPVLSKTVLYHGRMSNFSGLNETASCIQISKCQRTLISLNLHHNCLVFVYVLQLQLSGVNLHFKHIVTGSSICVMRKKVQYVMWQFKFMSMCSNTYNK